MSSRLSHGQPSDLLQLIQGHWFDRSTQTSPIRLCPRQTGPNALLEPCALKLCQGCEDVKLEAARGAAQVNSLSETDEADSAGVQIFE